MSEIKVNKISPRTACGTTTLGDSGDTFTIPAGVTITNSGTAAGFGATGAASWDTTVKTTGFTAVSGVGYFVNTTAGAISVNLPAGTAGDVVAIKDYINTFDTNAVTLVQNGSDKIGGSAVNATLSTEGIAVTLVFVDSTQGWLVTDDGLQSQASTAQYVTATGGTITCSGNCRIHTFTGPGTFCVSCAGNAAGSNDVSYIVIAGGGGSETAAPADASGGGGAGGFREGKSSSTPFTASPLAAAGLSVPAQPYTITIGGGQPGTSNGSPSTFSTITSAGGGAGKLNGAGAAGGSGGGGGNGPTAFGGAGNTPPTPVSQGFAGGDGLEVNHAPLNFFAGGGGGATSVGVDATPLGSANGGNGAGTAINPSPSIGDSGPSGSLRYFAGGGAGTSVPTRPNNNPATGGYGGGGDQGVNGAANTGGGAGGEIGVARTGGSGIVIIRYKFQN